MFLNVWILPSFSYYYLSDVANIFIINSILFNYCYYYYQLI